MFMINTAKNMFKREDYSESEEEKEYSDLEEQILDDYFEEKSQIDKNTFFVKIKPQGTALIKSWEKNRNVDVNFVKKCTRDQEDFFRENGRYNFPCPVHLCKIRDEQQYYTIDGQHRLDIYDRVENKNDRPSLPCIIHIVEDEGDISGLFEFINTRVFLELDVEKNTQEKIDMLKYVMEERFQSTTLKSIFGTNRPMINRENFFKKIRTTRCFKELDIHQITDKMVVINRELRNTNLTDITNDKISSTTYSKCQKSGFYLGLDKEMRWIKGL